MITRYTITCDFRLKENSDGETKIYGIINNQNIMNHTARKAQFKPDVNLQSKCHLVTCRLLLKLS